MLEIIVIGTHSKECIDLELNLLKAMEQMGLDVEFKKVSDLKEIAHYGVLLFPALMVNGKLMFEGFVPTVHDLKTHYLKQP